MKRILIIEDDPVIAEVQKDYLEASGFKVDIAVNGEEGLEKALEEGVDLIILDLMLPGTDGFEICRRIRREKNIPILMVSAKKGRCGQDPRAGAGRGRLCDETLQCRGAGRTGQGASFPLRALDRRCACERAERDPSARNPDRSVVPEGVCE